MLLFLAHLTHALVGRWSMLLFLAHLSHALVIHWDTTVCNLEFTLSVEELCGVCMCMLNIPQPVKQPPTKLIYLVTKEAPLYERDMTFQWLAQVTVTGHD